MNRRRILFSFICGIFAAAFAWLLLFPVFTPRKSTDHNLFVVTMNGTHIGALGSMEQIQECLRNARRALVNDASDFVLAESDVDVQGSYVVLGRIDDPAVVTGRMTQALNEGRKSTLNRAYTVKINEYAVNLSSMNDVYELIYASKRKYDASDAYEVALTPDPGREINVMTASILTKEEALEADNDTELPQAGIEKEMTEVLESAEANPEDLDFSAFELGLKTIGLGDKVEIVESYLPSEELTELTEAISTVTKDTETNRIYEVVAGDTLSTIAAAYGLTIDELIAMNPMLENENSTIRPQDELVVTVPEPLLSVTYTMEEYLEENFNAPVTYIENDDWYLDESEVIRPAETGHRRIIALTSYSDDTEISREIVKEEVTKDAVSAIIERGTKVRPTYVKPISGGSMTSGFGGRNFRGAEFHAGVDWGVPTGTSIFASSAGTVQFAGWGGGYGYCVFINHPDGRQTRYAHMSRTLVSTGDYVNQLDKIGLSGSTGDSTGPHVHFEVRVGGQAVDPLGVIEW